MNDADGRSYSSKGFGRRLVAVGSFRGRKVSLKIEFELVTDL